MRTGFSKCKLFVDLVNYNRGPAFTLDCFQKVLRRRDHGLLAAPFKELDHGLHFRSHRTRLEMPFGQALFCFRKGSTADRLLILYLRNP